MNKKVLVSGISGQAGSYLSEHLLKQGYEVYGLVRRVASLDQEARLARIAHIKDKIRIVPCDIGHYASVFGAMQKVMPDEIYHLAAQSFVKNSFEDPHETYAINFGGTINMLEAMKALRPEARFYFAATSEMFGAVKETPQTENTPFNPRSPYGIAKVAGYFATKNYREAHNMFCCSGICFNHRAPAGAENL